MKKFNWKARMKNKTWWLAIIGALLLLIQAILKPLGIELDFEGIDATLKDIVNAIFGLLVVLGVIIDPSTPGVTDKQNEVNIYE